MLLVMWPGKQKPVRLSLHWLFTTLLRSGTKQLGHLFLMAKEILFHQGML